jgi:hypothetical protein
MDVCHLDPAAHQRDDFAVMRGQESVDAVADDGRPNASV